MTTNISVILAQAQTLHQDNKLNEAMERYETVLELSPHNVDALQGLGLCHAQLKNMYKAIHYFLLALEHPAPDEALHNNLGNAYKAIGQSDKAIESYQKAIRINRNYAQAHHNIATLFATKDQYCEALEHYRIAVNLEPDFVKAHYNLGLLLLKHHELDAASIQFKNVLTLHPGLTDAHFYLGVLNLEANRLDDAEHDFHCVLDVDSEHVNALVNLGVIQIKRGQGQLAIDYFTKALGFDEGNVEARNNIAATFIHHDRYENALMHYDVLLKKSPNNIEYLYNSGVAQMALGHLEEARMHFEHILSHQESHFAALNNLAAVHSRLGHREHAIEFLRRAIAVKPDDSASQFMLNAMTGETLQPQACPDYVTHLFDNYAISYEKHMQDSLHYALPHQIARILHQFNGMQTQSRALDLGCGTGLMGSVMREISEHLTGIDLSAKMLALAADKAIYDHLVESEILAFLKETPESYSLIIAADIIPYLGELDMLFHLIKTRLATHGLFIFSTEISDDKPWKLQSSARFCHHETYIQALCTEYKLELIHQEQCIARTQDEHPLSVNIYVLSN